MTESTNRDTTPAAPERWRDLPLAIAAWIVLGLAGAFLVQPLAAQHGGSGHGDGDEHAAQHDGRHNDGGDAHGAGQHGEGGDHGDDHGAHDYPPLMEMEEAEIFNSFFGHLVPHAFYTPDIEDDTTRNALTFFDVNLFQLLAVALVFIVFVPVLASFGTAKPSWFVRVFRGWCLWIRDEIVYATMGPEEGRRFLPFFLFAFFFIAFANLLGLIPNSVTSTATIFVTGALAAVTFLVMIGGGVIRQGPVAFVKNLIPHGVPAAMVPLLLPLEIIGLIVKPVALAIRLFANMLAGHLVLYSFLGLIFLFAKMVEQSILSYPLAIPGVALGVFIFIIEGFVALLQAYIFVLLSCIFIQQSLHPDH